MTSSSSWMLIHSRPPDKDERLFFTLAQKARQQISACRSLRQFITGFQVCAGSLFQNKGDAIMEFLPLAHVVKISDEELEFVTGYDNMDEAKEVLFKGNVNMVLFTKGKDGAEAYTKDRVVKIPGNIVDVVDTTGAGDSFIGSFLFKLLEDDVNMEQLNSISDEKLREYLTFANAYAAYSTTKKGAIGSYATLDEIIKYMDK